MARWQVMKVDAFIRAHLDSTIRLQDLAGEVRLSTSHFSRAFRENVGISPYAYVSRQRLNHAMHLMLTTNQSLSEIAADCGMADHAHLCKLFRKWVRQSPAAWRRSQRGDFRLS
jgi:transcriptional regulator GlxA family with amidase domain